MTNLFYQDPLTDAAVPFERAHMASCARLGDALAAFDGPVVELHLSNPQTREAWRHTSVVAPVATGTIAGFGGDGYRLAIEAVAALLAGGGA